MVTLHGGLSVPLLLLLAGHWSHRAIDDKSARIEVPSAKNERVTVWERVDESFDQQQVDIAWVGLRGGKQNVACSFNRWHR